MSTKKRFMSSHAAVASQARPEVDDDELTLYVRAAAAVRGLLERDQEQIEVWARDCANDIARCIIELHDRGTQRDWSVLESGADYIVLKRNDRGVRTIDRVVVTSCRYLQRMIQATSCVWNAERSELRVEL